MLWLSPLRFSLRFASTCPQSKRIEVSWASFFPSSLLRSFCPRSDGVNGFLKTFPWRVFLNICQFISLVLHLVSFYFHPPPLSLLSEYLCFKWFFSFAFHGVTQNRTARAVILHNSISVSNTTQLSAEFTGSRFSRFNTHARLAWSCKWWRSFVIHQENDLQGDVLSRISWIHSIAPLQALKPRFFLAH